MKIDTDALPRRNWDLRSKLALIFHLFIVMETMKRLESHPLLSNWNLDKLRGFKTNKTLIVDRAAEKSVTFEYWIQINWKDLWDEWFWITLPFSRLRDTLSNLSLSFYEI